MTEESKYRQHFTDGAPANLTVVAWPDPIIEPRGHKPGSPYIEAVWLGILGPATVLCWSRLSRIAAVRPDTVVDTSDLAVSLGLSGALGRNAPMTRTLNRMVMFGTAQAHGDTIAVRRALPDVPQRMVRRLSYSAWLAHQRWATPEVRTAEQIPTSEVSPSIEVGM